MKFFLTRLVQRRTAPESQLRSQKLVAEDADQGLADDEVLLDHSGINPWCLFSPCGNCRFVYHKSSISISMFIFTCHRLLVLLRFSSLALLISIFFHFGADDFSSLCSLSAFCCSSKTNSIR